MMLIYVILAGAFIICFITAGVMVWRMQAGQTGPTVDDLYGPQTTMPGQTTLPTSSTLPPPSGGPFQLTVEDIFNIRGRGTVVTGRVMAGQVRKGEVILINGSRRVKVTGLEMFAKTLDTAQEGDNVGLLLEGINKEDVQRGDVLSK